MVRVIVALFVFGVLAIGWVLLAPEAAKKPQAVAAAPQPALAAAAEAAPPPTVDRGIRVVYPGPDVGAPVRKLADKVASGATLIPVAAEPAVAAADSTQQVATTTATAIPVPASPTPNQPGTTLPVAAPTPSVAVAPGGAVNINTASIDALNQIPGAGHVGRTIASHRPYASIGELVSKRVLRKSVYDKIKDQIATN